ncbi:MAG: ABC transporter substrate-binding protein [Lachnospiraceae bacterium]|nr:ABC transporter substrate-binding protein [Lachnospiraceae bacterium]
MVKRITVLLIVVMMIVPVLSGCKKEKENQITIVLDWTPNTNHTGLFVAQEKGYFKELGLNVKITEPPEGSTTQLIAVGKGQFGISFQDTLSKAYAQDEPLPVTVVAAVLQHNTSGVVSYKAEGIEKPKDLENKTYATWEDPIELAILKQIVEEDGGDFSKIELIPNTVTNIVAALETSIDSVWIYKAWDGIALDVAGKEYNFINFADYGEELDYYTPVIIANNDYLAKNGDEAKKVMSAIKKGYEYAIENPEEAADILLKACPENDKELVKQSQAWISTQYKADAAEWGVIDKERWDGFFTWLYDNKLIEKEIPSGFGFTNQFLEEKHE